jgi:glutamyl-tRNA reductase
MDRIGLLGIRRGAGESADLVPFTLAVEERPDALLRIRDASGVQELVYLATCNRVEVVFVGERRAHLSEYRPRIYAAITGREPEPGEAEQAFNMWAGEGAVEHLFLVAAGLDSSLVGETEIVGQMRAAMQLSRELGLNGPRTEWVFEEAWKTAKRARRATSLGSGKVSLAEIALQHARDKLSNPAATVGLVGVSPMTERCARQLSEERIPFIVYNRSRKRAEELARELGGEARALEEVGGGTDILEVLILATGAPEAVLGRADLEMLAGRADPGHAPLLIDMANPPDIEHRDAEAVGLRRIGLDEILRVAEEHRSRRLEHAAAARDVVDQALVDLNRKLLDSTLGPMFAAMQERYRATALEGVERLFARHLPELDEERRDDVRRWAQTLARRMAHGPTVGLRAVAKQSGFRAVETFFGAADDSLAKEVNDLARSDERPAPAADSPSAAVDEKLS